MLRRCFCTHKAGKLNAPLRHWYHRQVSQVWDTVIHPITNLVYIRQKNEKQIMNGMEEATNTIVISGHILPHPFPSLHSSESVHINYVPL